MTVRSSLAPNTRSSNGRPRGSSRRCNCAPNSAASRDDMLQEVKFEPRVKQPKQEIQAEDLFKESVVRPESLKSDVKACMMPTRVTTCPGQVVGGLPHPCGAQIRVMFPLAEVGARIGPRIRSALLPSLSRRTKYKAPLHLDLTDLVGARIVVHLLAGSG